MHNDHVNPNVGLGLLRACRKIYHEAHNLLYTQNTIYLAPTLDFWLGAATRLPLYVLRNLRHLLIVIACYRTEQEDEEPAQGDLGLLSDMTSLQSVRVCVISHVHNFGRLPMPFLSTVVESAPASCEILLGSESDVEKAFASKFLKKDWDDELDPIEINKSDLEEEMKKVMAVKGAKPGHTNLKLCPAVEYDPFYKDPRT
ncbi:hypothetical protein W97_01073 [Coniosporium apollinis CBS 100218]|uniref:Uncharacterized protein n=1 Tax=Coniosporium apollinis (strain CBS 100218) TaxID=1168221 RepID=R7YIW8_CONA1|nr:uncharacterized protein W97_01073 [Coniosporium apollinis CBS 100218]EON61855.1 hypothetical protein W97_01073 [Coniosporium apollinis CBS 100218]